MAYSNPTEQCFCTECGQRVVQGSRFCRTCGARLPEPDAVPQYDMAYMPPQTYAAPAPRQFYYDKAPQPQSPLRQTEQSSDRVLKGLVLILWAVYEALWMLYYGIGSNLPNYVFAKSLVSPIISGIALVVGLVGCLITKGKTKKIFGAITAGIFLFSSLMSLPSMLRNLKSIFDGWDSFYYAENAIGYLLQGVRNFFDLFIVAAFNILTILLCTNVVANEKKRATAALCLILWIASLCLYITMEAGLSLAWGFNNVEKTYANVLVTIFQLACCIGWLASGKSARKVWLILTLVAYGLSLLVMTFQSFMTYGIDLEDFDVNSLLQLLLRLYNTASIAMRCVTIIFLGYVRSDREELEDMEE